MPDHGPTPYGLIIKKSRALKDEKESFDLIFSSVEIILSNAHLINCQVAPKAGLDLAGLKKRSQLTKGAHQGEIL